MKGATKAVFVTVVALTFLCFVMSVLFRDWPPLVHSPLGRYARYFHIVAYLLLLLEGWLGWRMTGRGAG